MTLTVYLEELEKNVAYNTYKKHKSNLSVLEKEKKGLGKPLDELLKDRESEIVLWDFIKNREISDSQKHAILHNVKSYILFFKLPLTHFVEELKKGTLPASVKSKNPK